MVWSFAASLSKVFLACPRSALICAHSFGRSIDAPSLYAAHGRFEFKVPVNDKTGNLKYPPQAGVALSLEALLQQCRVRKAGRKRLRFEDRLQIPMLYLLYPD